MDVLVIVSSDRSAPVLAPLARALARSGARWGAFFTHHGVKLLEDDAIAEAVGKADTAIACQDSWKRLGPEAPCPIQIGSQTNNSAMVGEATRVVSL